MRRSFWSWQLFALLVALLPAQALAVITLPKAPGNIPDAFKQVDTALAEIFTIIIIVAGVVFVVLFFVGGMMYLTALGNEDGAKKARQLMIDAVIGLVIVVLAWSASQWVFTLLGLKDLEFSTGP